MRVLAAIFEVLFIALEIIQWTVFVWVVLSWIVFFASQTSFRWRYKTAYNILLQLNDMLNRMARPFLAPFRRMLRRVNTHGIDWSPILLLLAIILTQKLLGILYLYIISPR